MGTLRREIFSPFPRAAPADVEDGSGLGDSGFVGGLEEPVQFPRVGGVRELRGVVEDAVEGLVPREGGEQDQGGLRVRCLAAEAVRELSFDVGDDEGEVLDGGAASKRGKERVT